MYYAKPIKGETGTYEYHIRKCIEILNFELDRNKEVLPKVMDSINYSVDEFEKNTYLAVAMHDLGKLTNNFQSQMISLINNEKANRKEYFRHELVSVIYMIYATQKYIKENNYVFPYQYYAVLSHHKRIDSKFTQFEREKNKIEKWPGLTEETYKYGIDLVKRLSGLEIDLVENLNWFKFSQKSIWKFFDRYATESEIIKLGLNKGNMRTVYSLCKGILQYCDWIASADKDPLVQDITVEELVDKIKLKVEKNGKEYRELPFHEKCKRTKGDVIAIAPTGSGKTEASLLWALQFKKAKIIFLMPTMTTSNSIFERLSKNYFSEEICGLAHSNSDLFYELNDEYTGKGRFDLLQNKVFIPPVMVSTVDQLLTSGFNIGHWALKEYALLGSSIIIDEIQAYDTFTLALITETVKKIKRLGGNIMVMSATLPDFLLKHFKDLLNVEEPIVAEELMSRRNNKWRFIDKPLEEIIDIIEAYVDRDKKVAIIVNNVETAKDLYNQLSKHYKAICLHSEFTMKDRIEKEKLLNESREYEIVISTQVIEVSLDVSFNVIFSECAPIDSLVQRAGRCNRHGEYSDAEFIVFNYSDISMKYVYKDYSDILLKTKEVVMNNQELLSEYEIFKMVNEVYRDYNIYDKNYNRGATLYNQIENENIIFDIGYEEDKLKTRLTNTVKISIIPYRFKEIVEELFENKDYVKIRLYEVPVSVGRFKKYILKNYCENLYKLPIYTIEYSSETGIIYNDNTFEYF